MNKIIQAAFQAKDGQICGTGPCHNIDNLPENFDIASEGFIDSEGQYYTREQVTQEKHADHPIQSEEMDLQKVQNISKLPGLGFPDNRRETPIIKNPAEMQTKQKLMANAQGTKAKAVSSEQNIAGLTYTGHAPVNISFASGNSPSNTRPVATKLHEDFHLLMNRVGNKYGDKARKNLAENLYNAIPPESKDALRQYMTHLYKDPNNIPKGSFHEEHLAHVLSYLNSPANRHVFHKRMKDHWDPQKKTLTSYGREFQTKIKDAHKALQEAANKADASWLTLRKMQKSLDDDWKPSFEDLELAADIANIFNDKLPEFKAAEFMANGYKPNQMELEEALRLHEGDHIAAALSAFKIPITEENVKLLKDFMAMTDVNKSDIDVSVIPRIVKPFDESSVPYADMVRYAVEKHLIHKVQLNGKHSKGVALLRDETGQTWLLKPGSGSLSPALGVKEELASQSRREVAFNKIANIVGLSAYFPRSALIFMDGKEIAVLEFFSGGSYKTLSELKRNKTYDLPMIFNKFVGNGLLYKWAALDYLLGNVDRHAGNMMINDGHEIKFIDEGSTFAGFSYNPAKDVKSFVPYYLRVFAGRDFKVLTPEERFKLMPGLDDRSDNALKFWLDNLDEGKIVHLLNVYGLNPQPVIDRLQKIKDYAGPKSEFLRKFFAGLL